MKETAINNNNYNWSNMAAPCIKMSVKKLRLTTDIDYTLYLENYLKNYIEYMTDYTITGSVKWVNCSFK